MSLSASTSSVPSFSPCTVTSGDTFGTFEWSEMFSLPKHKFSFRLLECLREKLQLSRSLKSELVENVCREIIAHSKYPTTTNITDVARAIVREYQHLKETIGTGYGGWRQSIKDKLKNMRRVDDSEEVQNKKKSILPGSRSQGWRKSPRKNQQMDNSNVPPESIRDASCQDTTYVHSRQNKELCDGNINFANIDSSSSIREETGDDLSCQAASQSHTDRDVIDNNERLESLERTYIIRRQEIIRNKIKVSELMECYPGLFTKDAIEREWFRITSIPNIYSCISNFIEKHGETMYELLIQRKKLPAWAANIRQIFSMKTPTWSKDIMVLLTLPVHFWEESFIYMYPVSRVY